MTFSKTSIAIGAVISLAKHLSTLANMKSPATAVLSSQ
jgi:hypothetical protein